MVPCRATDYVWVMSTTAPSNLRFTTFAAILLAGFGAFSIWVVATRGYTGFLELAGRERWALQMLLDLVIGLSFAFGWVVRDARKRGVAVWPYAIATVLLGSIGILAYCVRRSIGAATQRPASHAVSVSQP